jgi:hypothetical protein
VIEGVDANERRGWEPRRPLTRDDAKFWPDAGCVAIAEAGFWRDFLRAEDVVER